MFKIMLKSNYDEMIKLQGCLESHIKGKDEEIIDITRTSIMLTPHEIQSGLTRVRSAENLIAQLPDTHDGRTKWLMNYGVGDEAKLIRKTHQENHVNVNLFWNSKTQSLIRSKHGVDCSH